MKILGIALGVLALTGGSVQAWGLTHSSPAESADYESGIFIRTDGRDPGNGDLVPAMCNGALLNHRLIVTAAHCVSDAQALHSGAIQVEVGRYRYIKRDGRVVRVGYAPYLQEQHVARFYFGRSLAARIERQGFSVTIGPDEDVAIIVLREPLKLAPDFIFSRTLGQREFSTAAEAIRNYSPRIATINPFEEPSADTKRFAMLDVIHWNSSGYFESTSTSRVQEGDSGAPLTVATAEGRKLIGVVKGEGRSFFGRWDAYAPLGPILCDISRAVQEAELRPLLCY